MGHPKVTQKTGLGMKRKEHPIECACKGCVSGAKSPFVDKKTESKITFKKRMKQVSTKQARRNRLIKEKLQIILEIQQDIYGQSMCEASRGHVDWQHKCPSRLGKYLPFVVDHVETRNQTNADRWENLQVLCSWCNYQKGSIRGLDFRPAMMIQAMKELDNMEMLNG
jgi:5-methylcytosine-specific restriction endonuclease McrA